MRPRPAIVLLAIATAVPAFAKAVVEPDRELRVRVYGAPAAEGAHGEALDVVAAIVRQAGLEIRWIACDDAVEGREADCAAPLPINQLAIRLVRRSAHTSQDLVALGESLIDTRIRAGSLATIYVDRVWSLAARCGLGRSTLLGRAMAHEIGHLLLGTTRHTPSGLMRAEWRHDSLRQERPEDWVFAPADAQAIRDALRVRRLRQVASARFGH